jgi:hypothetical protein
VVDHASPTLLIPGGFMPARFPRTVPARLAVADLPEIIEGMA